ncbi:hypothetical protein PSTG_12639 [Puccinia striiformis f. sp. tritici PST-78]|uniref:HSF-type DNA-binding domain-containing protein n=1 Tax=Puccinia striiformis f. sp. tritici PST-78 TaxID=1165861 RepID=A0A0L0V3V3_9BASI|nr:hypothetical protein PSTG_12639 [Puccinia striiformis f. sp. tritici PST-78]
MNRPMPTFVVKLQSFIELHPTIQWSDNHINRLLVPSVRQLGADLVDLFGTTHIGRLRSTLQKYGFQEGRTSSNDSTYFDHPSLNRNDPETWRLVRCSRKPRVLVNSVSGPTGQPEHADTGLPIDHQASSSAVNPAPNLNQGETELDNFVLKLQGLIKLHHTIQWCDTRRNQLIVPDKNKLGASWVDGCGADPFVRFRAQMIKYGFDTNGSFTKNSATFQHPSLKRNKPETWRLVTKYQPDQINSASTGQPGHADTGNTDVPIIHQASSRTMDSNLDIDHGERNMDPFVAKLQDLIEIQRMIRWSDNRPDGLIVPDRHQLGAHMVEWFDSENYVRFEAQMVNYGFKAAAGGPNNWVHFDHPVLDRNDPETWRLVTRRRAGQTDSVSGPSGQPGHADTAHAAVATKQQASSSAADPNPDIDQVETILIPSNIQLPSDASELAKTMLNEFSRRIQNSIFRLNKSLLDLPSGRHAQEFDVHSVEEHVRILAVEHFHNPHLVKATAATDSDSSLEEIANPSIMIEDDDLPSRKDKSDAAPKDTKGKKIQPPDSGRTFVRVVIGPSQSRCLDTQSRPDQSIKRNTTHEPHSENFCKRKRTQEQSSDICRREISYEPN